MSWKTTLAGVIGGLALIFTQVSTLLDNDPNTNPDWKVVVAGAAMIGGGFAARDNDVTSEKAGAK